MTASSSSSSGPSASAVTFPGQVDARCEVELLRRLCQTKEAEENVKAFRSYVFGKEESWVLNSAVLPLAKDILQTGSPEMKVKLFRLFAHCALHRSGFSAILCSDRRENIIMCHLRGFDKLGVEEQKAAALFLVHLSSRAEGRTALFYLSRSQWTANGTENGGSVPSSSNGVGGSTDNAHISADAARHCLTSYNPCMKEYGVAIIHNLSLKFIAPNQEDPSNNGEYDSEVPLKCVAAEQLLEELRCALVEMKQQKSPASVEAVRAKAIANLTFD